MTKRELIEALETLDCSDDVEVNFPNYEYATEHNINSIKLIASSYSSYILLESD